MGTSSHLVTQGLHDLHAIPGYPGIPRDVVPLPHTRRMDATTLLTRLVSVLDAKDWDALPDLLHPDFTCRLVHTGEVVDRDAWVRLNADYPGFVGMRLDEVVGEGTRGALRATVTGTGPEGQEATFVVAGFATVRDARIEAMVEVWADVDQQPPPGTRAPH